MVVVILLSTQFFLLVPYHILLANHKAKTFSAVKKITKIAVELISSHAQIVKGNYGLHGSTKSKPMMLEVIQ